MRRATVLWASIAAATLAGAGHATIAAAGAFDSPSSVVTSSSRSSEPPRLLPAPECAAAADPTPLAPPSAPGAILITVTVPAMAFLDLDADGHMVSATTNTGCAPSPSDDLRYRHPDGSIGVAPATVLDGIRWFVSSAKPTRFVPGEISAAPPTDR